MFPHNSIVINNVHPEKVLSWLLLVGTALCIIACTFSGKGIIIPYLVISKPRHSKLSLAKNDFSALILKLAAIILIKNYFYFI